MHHTSSGQITLPPERRQALSIEFADYVREEFGDDYLTTPELNDKITFIEAVTSHLIIQCVKDTKADGGIMRPCEDEGVVYVIVDEAVLDLMYAEAKTILDERPKH